MIMVHVWWLVCGYLPTAIGAALTVARLRQYRGRHHAFGRRRSAPSTFSLSMLGAPETAELRAERARIEAVAQAIEERARVWSDERTPNELAESWLGIIEHEPAPELHTFEHGAGSEAYLAVTPAALAQPGAVRGRATVDRDRRIDTQEMRMRFGDELGPVLGPLVDDEWVLPDEDGDDPGTGRHARGRERVTA